MSWHIGREGAQPGALGYYDYGITPYFALQSDPRFSYCLYVPRKSPPAGYRLLVALHGTARHAEGYRDAFADFAEAKGALVLAPLFPAGIEGPEDLSDYKRLRSGTIPYDLRLLDMVAEVAARYPLREGGFFLHGFSGGGHFAHRFLLAHPQQLAGVSIGAPGIVTLPDPQADWWAGIRDFAAVFGHAPDLAAIARVPVHVCVGDRDTETWEITLAPGDGWWMQGAEWQAQATRIARAERLVQALREVGCDVRFDLVPGAGHDGAAMIPCVQHWMAGQLSPE